MAGLLNEVDVNIQTRAPLKTVKSSARRKTRVLSPPLSSEHKMSHVKAAGARLPVHAISTPPSEPNYNDDDGFSGAMDDEAFPASDPIPSSPTTTAVDRKGQGTIKVEDEEEDDMMEVAQVIGDDKVKAVNINISGSRPVKKVKQEPAYPSPASSSPTRPSVADIDPSAWNEVTSKLNVVSAQEPKTTSPGKLKIEDAVEPDGSLNFFWTDYTEVNGSLCLFGKVKNQKLGTFVSSFVKVDNILRKVYFLPRTHRQSKLLLC